MRPRVFPAENITDARARWSARPWGFNEAAGIPRGKRADSLFNSAFSACFNEAAGIPRGKRGVRYRGDRAGCASFNEAAGIPRGKLYTFPVTSFFISASMRPRVFPAENRA